MCVALDTHCGFQHLLRAWKVSLVEKKGRWVRAWGFFASMFLADLVGLKVSQVSALPLALCALWPRLVATSTGTRVLLQCP